MGMILLRFLIVPKPYENESLVSFIGRITIENKFITASWIFGDLIPYHLGVSQFNPDEFSLNRLYELTGIEETQLWKLTLCYDLKYEENNFEMNKVLFSNGLVGPKVRVCPQCLKENNFGSKIWDIKIYTSCAIHSVELITNCPSCNKEISLLRGSIYYCPCGFDFRDIHMEKGSNTLNLQRSMMIHSKFDKNFNIGNNNCLKELMSILEIDSIILIYHIFFRIYFLYIERQKRVKIPYIMNEVDNKAINWIDNILCDWPKNFLKFLDDYSSISKNTKYYKTSLFKSFGTLYKNLYKKEFKDYLLPVVNEFENYLHNFWDNSNLSVLKYLNYNESKSKYLSFKRAREIFNISEGNLRKLLSTGYINYKKVNKNNILVEKESLEKYIQLDLLNKGEVSQYLNVTNKVVTQFETAGFFSPIRGSKIDGHQKHLYLKKEILQFINRIVKCATKILENEIDKDFVSIDNIYGYLRDGFNPSDIINFIFEGSINVYVVDNDAENLDALFLNIKELSVFLYKYKIENSVGTFSYIEAADFLGIHYTFLQRIINKYKLINKIRSKNSILVKDVLAFKESYITLEDLAIESNEDYKVLLKKLEGTGIKPVEDCFYIKRKIYLRSDIPQKFKIEM